MSCRSSPTIPNHTKPRTQRVRRVKKDSKEVQKSQKKKEKEILFMKSGSQRVRELGCQRVRGAESQGVSQVHRDLRSKKVRRVSKELKKCLKEDQKRFKIGF